MKPKNQEELDNCAVELVHLRDKSNRSKNKAVKKAFETYQNQCIEKFGCLVRQRASRYRRFSNHADLEQDGYEALLLALKTYNPDKGSFTWWADRYISTRISRAANAHSTIRFPLKKAKDMKPFKTSTMPILVDDSSDPFTIAMVNQKLDQIKQIISSLPDDQRRLVSLIYGLNGAKESSVDDTLKILSISRTKYLRMLEEAKETLKEKLGSFVGHE